jgi:hypothetical protein
MMYEKKASEFIRESKKVSLSRTVYEPFPPRSYVEWLEPNSATADP